MSLRPCANSFALRSTGRRVVSRPGRSCLQALAMRAVVQRVSSASVEVDGEIISSIGPGLLCLIGVKTGDTERDMDYVCTKILKTRLWPQAETNKPWCEDVASLNREILCVSQFTLYGRLKKAKPDYSKAMSPEPARQVYQSFLELLGKNYQPEKIKDGRFGAMMNVQLVNDGPVTYIIDSEDGYPPSTTASTDMDA